MSRNSRRDSSSSRTNRRSEIIIQPLEQRTMLSATNSHNFADAEGDQTARLQQEANIQKPQPGAAFSDLDANSDGQLVPEELSEQAWTRLSQADANDDCGVTLQELQTFRQENERNIRKPDAETAHARLDANEDGSLTADEVAAPIWNRILGADSNGDGAVTLDELLEAREADENEVEKPNRAARFSRLDVNEDGALTEDEVSEKTWARISRADANGDDAVTPGELQAARQHHEHEARKPMTVRRFEHLDVNDDGALTADEVSADAWNRLSRVDQNQDQAVTLEELRKARRKHEHDVRKPNPGDAFARLDANEDGKLTVEEVTEEAWERLSQADTNGDGAITPQELVAARERDEHEIHPNPRPGNAFARLDVNNDGAITPDEVRPQTWNAKLASADANNDGAVTLEELQARAFAALDDNGDGFITPNEVSPQMWHLLRRSDANKDGKVSLEEKQAGQRDSERDLQKPGNGQAFDRLDANDDGKLTADEVSQRLWAKLARADTNDDGAVTLDELQGGREQDEDEVRDVNLARAFRRLDVNDDGQLTQDEVAPALWQKISRADTNDDGGVTMEELRKARRKDEDRIRKPNAGDHFEHLDTNGDGKLTVDEVGDKAWERISGADTNDDGGVTLAELEAARENAERHIKKRRPGKVFDHLDANDDGALTQDEVSPQVWERISEADANEDGKVTKRELRRARRADERKLRRPDSAAAFARLDSNDDGKITADEVSERAWARLSRADANDDGAVTPLELRHAREQAEDRVERPGPRDRFRRLDSNDDGQITEDEVGPAAWARISRADADEDGGVTLRELHEYRSEHERRIRKPSPQEVFARLDANEDGRLTPDEVNRVTWARLSRADANSDDAVTLHELREFRRENEDKAQRPKPGEVFARLDVNEDGQLTADEVNEEVWVKLSRADANEDGAVTLEELRAWRREHEDKAQRPKPGEVFARLDVNEDGQLTADEVSEEVWVKLSRADANEDGAVTLEELRAWRREHEDKAQRPKPGEVFARLDVNEDGQLTAHEVNEEVWVKLSRADANEDGAVTLEELRAWRREHEDKAQRPKPGEVFARLDVNEDGQLTADEVNEEVWVKLSRADANEDGAVTLEELRAWRREHEDKAQRPKPGEVFARLDVNEDGQLTADEVNEEVWVKLSRADANEDGAVTLEELRAWRREHEDKAQRPKPGEVFARLDVNEDGQLTADEVSEEVWKKISRADANEDGAVTLEELRAWRREHEDKAQRPKPGEVFARLDVNEDGQLTADEVSEEVWVKLSRADANEDGAVTLEELRAWRREHEDKAQRPKPADAFSDLDVNQDGQLTGDEVSDDVWDKISLADANTDGGVTLAELLEAREEREDKAQRPDPEVAFVELDVNDDGQLSEDEVSARVWTRISRADTNDDGGVTLQELRSHRDRKEKEVRTPDAEDAFVELDIDEDGELTASEVSRTAWRIFSNADANIDGGVSQAELQAARDAAGISVIQSNGGTSVSESGSQDTLQIVLTGKPLEDVVITVASGDESEVVPATTSLVFTPENWDEPQSVNLTGIDDSEVDGAQSTDITLAVDSNQAATEFATLPEIDVPVVTVNDETSPGNVDGDAEFDANDSFMIHLLLLSGSNSHVELNKGTSLLTAEQIRSFVDDLRASGDVDGDNDFDANDSFLIHMVELAGSNDQIDNAKGASPLTATQIRENVKRLGTPAPVRTGGRTASISKFASGPVTNETDVLFAGGETPTEVLTDVTPDAPPTESDDSVWGDVRDWIDLI